MFALFIFILIFLNFAEGADPLRLSKTFCKVTCIFHFERFAGLNDFN